MHCLRIIYPHSDICNVIQFQTRLPSDLSKTRKKFNKCWWPQIRRLSSHIVNRPVSVSDWALKWFSVVEWVNERAGEWMKWVSERIKFSFSWKHVSDCARSLCDTCVSKRACDYPLWIGRSLPSTHFYVKLFFLFFLYNLPFLSTHMPMLSFIYSKRLSHRSALCVATQICVYMMYKANERPANEPPKYIDSNEKWNRNSNFFFLLLILPILTLQKRTTSNSVLSFFRLCSVLFKSVKYIHVRSVKPAS